MCARPSASSGSSQKTNRAGPTAQWVGTTYDTEDLLETFDDPLGTGAFRYAAMAVGNHMQCCQWDYYAVSFDDQLGDDWDHFVETVKYQARHVFLWLAANGKLEHERFMHGRDERRGGQMLSRRSDASSSNKVLSARCMPADRCIACAPAPWVKPTPQPGTSAAPS